MIVIDYKKKYHKEIIKACVHALKQGNAVAYPTDTSYGLAVDATNLSAVKKLYKIKGRNFNKPVHVVVPSVRYAKTITRWNNLAEKLAKKFWPGPLTLVLALRVRGKGYGILSAGTKTIGLRMPNNKIALDLAEELGRPISATSANLSGCLDSYSAQDVQIQFSAKGGSAFGGKNVEHKPDIIINDGKLLKRKPSTVVKVVHDEIIILREGPISEEQIRKVVSR